MKTLLRGLLIGAASFAIPLFFTASALAAPGGNSAGHRQDAQHGHHGGKGGNSANHRQDAQHGHHGGKGGNSANHRQDGQHRPSGIGQNPPNNGDSSQGS